MYSFGTITPSSNVIVERVTLAMTKDLPNISPHFARFGHAGSKDASPDDYDWTSMLDAAALLGDAELDLICWNGSKGGLVGFDRDRLLCERISAVLARPAVTSTLALAELLQSNGLQRIGFVTPYADAVNRRIAAVWEGEGFQCLPPVGAGLSDNFSYSTLTGARLSEMADRAAAARPDCIVFYCTNMNGAPLCVELERAFGVPVFDSVSAGVWKSLSLLGQGKWDLAARWGRLLT